MDFEKINADDTLNQGRIKINNNGEAVRGQISELKSDLDNKQNKYWLGKNLFDKDASDIVKGYFLNASGEPQKSDSGVAEISDYIEVSENTTYTFTSVKSENVVTGYFHAFYDKDKRVIGVTQNVSSPLNITTPPKCLYIRLSLRERNADEAQFEIGSVATDYETYGRHSAQQTQADLAQTQADLAQTQADLAQTQADLAQMQTISPNLCNEATATRGKYMDKNGNIGISSTGALSYSAKINVIPGITYFAAYNNANRNGYRFITALDSSGKVVQSASDEQKESWTCPDGIASVVVSYFNDADGFIFSANQKEEYVPYGIYVPFEKIEKKAFNTAVLNLINNKTIKNPFLRSQKETLTDGESIKLQSNGVKTYKTIIFTCDINSFNQLEIGHGKTEYTAYYATIDNAKVTVKSYSGITVGSFNHGLTIKNNLQVEIRKAEKTIASIKIVSNGETFEQECEWMGDNGSPYVTSVESTLEKCVLSWTCSKINSDIWLFGDSYFGMRSADRWIYHLLSNGHTDCLISGWGGRNSEHAYLDFAYLLKLGTPKKVIWCLGMNDNDSATAVNSSWLNRYNSMIQKCEENNIELILSTIPNAVGGTVDDNPDASLRQNKFKNEIVKNSGYRYIDFASAVGAKEDGTWYDKMLSSDGVHPTEFGATALYMQALADVPELANC